MGPGKGSMEGNYGRLSSIQTKRSIILMDQTAITRTVAMGGKNKRFCHGDKEVELAL